MTPYDFEVLKDGVVIDIQSIHLPHIRFAWPEIIRLARRFRGPGHKIRVKDDAGGIVILTGVDAVRRHTGNEQKLRCWGPRASPCRSCECNPRQKRDLGLEVRLDLPGGDAPRGVESSDGG